MALPSTLYRFHLELADVDRDLYRDVEIRIAMHPSETPPYLLTRVLAYALELREGLEIGKGLCNPDDPALEAKDPTGIRLLWIEVGNPSARRLHKATKAAREVRVYTYKDPDLLLAELAAEPIHAPERLEIVAVPPPFLASLEKTLERDNDWKLLRTGDELTVSTGEDSLHATLRRLSPPAKRA